MAHPFRVQLNLVFFDVSAQHGYLCHPSGGQQARANRPVRNRAEVEHGGRVGGQTDNQHFAQDRRLRAQRRLAHVDGEGFTDYRQFLADNLAGEVDVCSPVKFHPDNGEAVGGRRTDTAYTGSTVYGCFDRKGNELFHFLGCHTIGFGHDNHRRGVEVGEDVNFGIHGSVGARDEQEESRAEYDQPVMQGVMYNFVKHDNSSIE